MNKKLFIIMLLVFVLVMGVSAGTTTAQKKGDMSIGLELGNPDGVSFKWQFDDKLSMTAGLGYILWPFSGLDVSGGVEYMVLEPTYFDKQNHDWWFLLTVGGKLDLGYGFGSVYYGYLGSATYGGGFIWGISVPVAFTVQTSELPIEFGLALAPGYQGMAGFGTSVGGIGSVGGSYSSYFKFDSTLFVRYRF